MNGMGLLNRFLNILCNVIYSRWRIVSTTEICKKVYRKKNKILYFIDSISYISFALK
jgi:hypothetical protein